MSDIDENDYVMKSPREPIRVEYRGSTAYFLDADDYCFAVHVMAGIQCQAWPLRLWYTILDWISHV
jgi:hypothetical protein